MHGFAAKLSCDMSGSIHQSGCEQMSRKLALCVALVMPLLVSAVVLASPTELPLLEIGQRDRLARLVEQRLSQGHELWLIAEAADVTGPDGTTLASQADRPRPHKMWAGDPAEFFKGAFVGFLGHESGHLIANLAVGSSPDLKGVEFSFIPFFTIEPGRELSNREHYITASAGFNAQHIINEWLLEEHPNLRNEDEPFLKGLATLNFWLTVGYSATAFAGYGPDERDTKGMADSLGWSEDSIGALILVPTLLDAYRYKHPDSKWARRASRISKIIILGLALKIDD